jgi:hypothetical protein
MKKHLVLTILVLLMVMLVGCVSGQAKNQETEGFSETSTLNASTSSKGSVSIAGNPSKLTTSSVKSSTTDSTKTDKKENESTAIGSETSSIVLEDEPVSFSIGVKDNSPHDRENHSAIKIVYTLDELKKICEKVSYAQEYIKHGFEEPVFHRTRYYLDQMTQKYDAKYFESNALVLYLFVETGEISIQIDAVNKQGQTLLVETTRLIPQ